jgi:hypothetical protein
MKFIAATKCFGVAALSAGVSLSPLPTSAQEASKPDSPCRATYESVMLLMLEQNCTDDVEITPAGHKFQLENGKKPETMGCIVPATDTIKSEMGQVTQAANGVGIPPTELWCTGAAGMFRDTPEHQTWVKILK